MPRLHEALHEGYQLHLPLAELQILQSIFTTRVSEAGRSVRHIRKTFFGSDEQQRQDLVIL